eukprot:jgi/Botrbrau1/18197/Bobra.53_1s0058.1
MHQWDTRAEHCREIRNPQLEIEHAHAEARPCTRARTHTHTHTHTHTQREREGGGHKVRKGGRVPAFISAFRTSFGNIKQEAQEMLSTLPDLANVCVANALRRGGRTLQNLSRCTTHPGSFTPPAAGMYWQADIHIHEYRDRAIGGVQTNTNPSQ